VVHSCEITGNEAGNVALLPEALDPSIRFLKERMNVTGKCGFVGRQGKLDNGNGDGLSQLGTV